MTMVKATRRRSILTDCGAHLRVTNAERLADLRRRVASSENTETLKRIADEGESLAGSRAGASATRPMLYSLGSRIRLNVSARPAGSEGMCRPASTMPGKLALLRG